jgi:pimeloyl-ACP methyl ester carboxylesterase
LDEFMQRIAAVPHLTHATLEDAGHMLHHDQPEPLAKLIEEFLCLQAVT